MKRLPIVGVIGSHTDSHTEFANPLGRLIAESGCHLLTGGGGGVMTAVAHSFTSHPVRKGLCIGIVPIEAVTDLKKPPRYTNPYIEVPIFTHLHQRVIDGTAMPMAHNEVNILSSDLIIGLPGLKGTEAETSMALVFDKPIILFGNKAEFSNFPDATMVAEVIEDVGRFMLKKIHEHKPHF
jgi:uncharacterized protein (TIGR00725 family)